MAKILRNKSNYEEIPYTMCTLFYFLFFFICVLPKKRHLNKVFTSVLITLNFVSTEEEAAKLRHFVDEPAFTDLHWETLHIPMDVIARYSPGYSMFHFCITDNEHDWRKG
ncbi:hypothetical protein A4A49_17486 [Nicotiana attenuata]|uniref:Uncharacterized protein n=1 Tax=Nicotiana attenuata TaxID=49451 RepID=A0A314L626_NICAT|nr:hypothetical protein A4A49_17486 [Nicotiana attenuata]